MEYSKELHEKLRKNPFDGIWEYNAIPCLLAEIDRLTKLTQWIPVSERLPEEEKNVLGTNTKSKAVDSCCYADGFWWQDGHKVIVTYWIEFPNPPEVS